MSNTTFHILRSALIAALLGAALYFDWPIIAGVLVFLFALSL